jgi:hypothetical protein
LDDDHSHFTSGNRFIVSSHISDLELFEQIILLPESEQNDDLNLALSFDQYKETKLQRTLTTFLYINTKGFRQLNYEIISNFINKELFGQYQCRK